MKLVLLLLLALYSVNFVMTLGSGIKLDYMETKYPVVNLYEDEKILYTIKTLYNRSDCKELLNLYKEIPKDKVIRKKLINKEAYYFARYIGIKSYIKNKLLDLFKKNKCGLDIISVLNVERISNIRKKMIDYIEEGMLDYAQYIANKHKFLNIQRLLREITKNNRRKSKWMNKKRRYEELSTIPVEKCDNKRSFISKYPQNKFFTQVGNYVIFFEVGNMHIYDIVKDNREVINLYDNIAIASPFAHYIDLKNNLGIEVRGYKIYMTVFTGNFFTEKTYERLGINIIKEYTYMIPTYKILLFDLYHKKILWETKTHGNFSFFSPPTFGGDYIYAMCGEFSGNEVTNYLCKVNKENGIIIDKVYISTDEIFAISRDKKTIISIEYSKPYRENVYLYIVLYTSGLVLKYDFKDDLVIYLLKLRRKELLPLPLKYKDNVQWVGNKIFVFSIPINHNFFIVDKKSGKLITVIPRSFLGDMIKKCYTYNESFVCISNQKLCVFKDEKLKIKGVNVEDIYIDEEDIKIYFLRGKKIYLAKNLFLYKIRLMFVLGNEFSNIEELLDTRKYLLIKGIKNNDCIVAVYEKR